MKMILFCEIQLIKKIHFKSSSLWNRELIQLEKKWMSTILECTKKVSFRFKTKMFAWFS